MADSDPDDDELALEEAVFGDAGAHTLERQRQRERSTADAEAARLEDEGMQENAVRGDDGAALFFIDKGTRGESQVGIDEDGDEERPAWEDEDDKEVEVDLSAVLRLRKLRRSEDETVVSGLEYTRRLREQHDKLYAGHSWALPRKRRRRESDGTDDEDDEEDGALLRSTNPLSSFGRGAVMGSLGLARSLPPGRLDISRAKDANQHAPSKAVVQAVDWHRNAELLLTAGFDKTLRIFQADGKTNAKVQSVHLPDMPLSAARFVGPSHAEVVCVGRRPFFYVYDIAASKVVKVPRILGRKERSLETMVPSPPGSSGLLAFLGNDGHVVLVAERSKQWAFDLKMNGSARCAAFSSDGNAMYTAGGEGEVYKWDLRTRRCICRHKDEGSLETRSLALSLDGTMYATGSTSGVVNLYEAAAAEEACAGVRVASPKPFKTVMNLTTAIDDLDFSPDAQLLAMLSRRKKQAFRLLNVPERAVVPNWPTAGTPIGYAACARFSPHGGFLAVGNDKGKCMLYRVGHYAAA